MRPKDSARAKHGQSKNPGIKLAVKNPDTTPRTASKASLRFAFDPNLEAFWREFPELRYLKRWPTVIEYAELQEHRAVMAQVATLEASIREAKWQACAAKNARARAKREDEIWLDSRYKKRKAERNR